MSTNQDSTPQFSQLLRHLMRGGQFGYWWRDNQTSVWWPVAKPTNPAPSKHNTYFGVNPSREIPTTNAKGEPKDPEFVRSRNDTIAAINTLFAEFDAKHFAGGKPAALAHVHGLSKPASVIIDSGGGYHCYWLLADTFIISTDADRQRARALQFSWVDSVGSDGGAKDLARVLRVPGTKNYKPDYGPDYPTVTIISADFARLYTVADLDMTTQAPTPAAKQSKPAQPIALDDQALIEKAMNAANGAKFSALWRGDTSAYIGKDGKPDDSIADAAMCELLAYWCGGDAARMERLWLASGLQRDKLQRADYRKRTIDFALSKVTTFYDPTYHAPADVPAQPEQPPFDDDMMTTPTPAAAKQKTERKPATKSAAYITALGDLGYSFRLNELTQEIEVNGVPITDHIAAEIRVKMRDLTYTSTKAFEDAYTAHALRNSYHPIKSYLNSLKWDGLDHIEQLGTFLVDSHAPFANGDKVARRLLRRWLIGVVGKVFDRIQTPMLVIEGKQSLGKSHFVAWLASVLPDYFIEGPISPDDKDAKIRLMSRWLWEVSELGATTRRADVEALKSFITLRDVTVRKPYGHHDVHAPAVCSLIGTLNDSGGFLNDTTGSRRFLTLALTDLNWGYKDFVNVSQVWAQAVALYRAGESPYLTPDERAKQNEINETFTAVDPVEDILTSAWFEIDPSKDWFTTSSAITTVVDNALRGTSTSHARAIAAYLKSRGIESTRKGVNRVRGYIGVRIVGDPKDRPDVTG